MASLSCGKLAIWAAIAVLLQIIGLLLFVFAFFPMKAGIPGTSGPESFGECCEPSHATDQRKLPPHELKSLYKEISGMPAVFDKLILMVVDGLPAEFILGREGSSPVDSMMKAMPYTQVLLHNGSAIGFHAKAAPPTVTMPRLKALVSGIIPGFLDVAFNFNTQAFQDDNLLEQLRSIGWRILMYGDETWARLFPNMFTRSDGVSSFYVKDTTEVDYNVSRHLEAELVADDWNLMILHYLGLDHAGHIGGRYSALMNLKLQEMDEIIKMLHVSTIMKRKPFESNTLLLVISDHGMTDGGNHGGSSYEETDSLAIFIGLSDKVGVPLSGKYSTVNQVDVAPTLALLFGVPIPQNSVGIVISSIFNFLTDEQWLRALELNSWQLLRLLKMYCVSMCTVDRHEENVEITDCGGTIETKMHCLYTKATALHHSWKLEMSRIGHNSGIQHIVDAYSEFLQVTSQWLSRKTTDRSFRALGGGVLLILISSSVLLGLMIKLCKESWCTKFNYSAKESDCGTLVEKFTCLAVLIHILSLISSSMVEEEQYTWHFLTSTLYILFLHSLIQHFPGRSAPTVPKACHAFTSDLLRLFNCHSLPLNYLNSYCQIYFIVAVLICSRILRGWHQGGVNWRYLPDISVWLEQTSMPVIRFIQIFSMLLVSILGLFCSCTVKTRPPFSLFIKTAICISGLLILVCKELFEKQTSTDNARWGTLTAQIIYAIILLAVVTTLVVLPWSIPIGPSSTASSYDHTHAAVKDCLYSVGCIYVIFWCFMQLLLQQRINSGPIVLLLLQLLASIKYFSLYEVHPHHNGWVQVAALYFLGMSGHYGLGNTNTLASVDVAGAYMGLSSYSAALTGILAFMITYASLIIFLLGLVMYVASIRTEVSPTADAADFGSFLKSMIGLPCIVPLSLNSVVLLGFTVILLIMRGHLFIWSVFSPKYLFVCATTVCVWLGVSIIATTGIYTSLIIFIRTKRFV